VNRLTVTTFPRTRFKSRFSVVSQASVTDFCHNLNTYLLHQSFQTFCGNDPHVDFAFADFVMPHVILATLKIMIRFDFVGQKASVVM